MVDEKNAINIKTSDRGFYEGFNVSVALVSKILIFVLIMWAVLFREHAGPFLLELQSKSTSIFGAWYIYVTAFFVVVCLGVAIIPKSGKILLGKEGEKPEFSNFSWLSMMFGAGIGVGMLTYATAEPIFHFANNPDVIKGNTNGQNADNVRMAYKWAFLHYGLTPWACYGITGLSLAYFSYNRGLPLTIRSGLQPLFGRSLSGILGNVVDIAAILATIIGIGVTIGYGVSQFAAGVFNIIPAQWIMTDEGKPETVALLLALLVIIFVSILSALSGVGRGIKWLSNINMGLSLFLLSFFVVCGAALFAFQTFFTTLWDYLLNIVPMSLTVWQGGDETQNALKDWQGAWTIFYWAWWIAFAPFVGLFLSRVSRGRTIRSFIVGAMIVPSLICLTWFVLAGGTAIDLELSGIAQGSIVNTDISNQLFQTINLLLSPERAIALSVVIVILLLTFLVTSADSAILVVNTIASGGDPKSKHPKHVIIWGVILGSTVAALLVAGGLDALRSAMILGALPFSVVMALTAISLVKALFFEKS